MGSAHRTTSLPSPVTRMRRLLALMASDRSEPGIDVRPAANQIEAQAVERLLTEQVTHRTDRPFPDGVRQDNGTLRPTLIGAWTQDDLVAGAFIGPHEIAAQDFARFEGNDAAQMIRRHVALIEGIAVSPEHRREGIGLKLKMFCDRWAADHQAALVCSIPTNQAAARLNKKAGHIVLERDVMMVMQITDDHDTPLTRAIAMGRTPDVFALWAFRVVTKTTGCAIRIGEHRPIAGEYGTEHDLGGVRWLDTTATPRPPKDNLRDHVLRTTRHDGQR